MDKVTGVVDRLILFKGNHDGTYDYSTSKLIEYCNGYQVSFVRPEAFELLSKQQWDLITNYLCEYIGSGVNVGVYQGCAEISFHCIPKDKALEIMEKYNQESIMDWEKKKTYPDNAENWFIFNMAYDESKLVNYDEIIRKIQ